MLLRLKLFFIVLSLGLSAPILPETAQAAIIEPLDLGASEDCVAGSHGDCAYLAILVPQTPRTMVPPVTQIGPEAENFGFGLTAGRPPPPPKT